MRTGRTSRCPSCGTEDIHGFHRTRTGRTYYCTYCRKGWRVAIEDEVLDMLAGSRVTRENHGRKPGRS